MRFNINKHDRPCRYYVSRWNRQYSCNLAKVLRNGRETVCIFIDETRNTSKHHQPLRRIDNASSCGGGRFLKSKAGKAKTGYRQLFGTLPIIRMICWILAGALVAVVSLYGLIELHYFMRMFLTVFLARFCKKKVSIFDETVVYGEFSENTCSSSFWWN